MTNIEQARLRAGLNKTEMSKLFNIPYRTLQHWELGERRPPEWAEALLIKELNNIAKSKSTLPNISTLELMKSICGVEAAININKTVSDYLENADIQKLLLAVYCAENKLLHERLFRYKALRAYINNLDIYACAAEYVNSADFAAEDKKSIGIQSVAEKAHAVYGVIMSDQNNFKFYSLPSLNADEIKRCAVSFAQECNLNTYDFAKYCFYGTVIDLS